MIDSAIASGVATWSRQNFNDQKGIEHIAPLLGLVEELGELTEAIEQDRPVDPIHDAVGDIGIYCLDFIARAGLDVMEVWPDTVVKLPHSPLVYLSRMVHACLKRHQGIRGFDNDVQFKEVLTVNTQYFLHAINSRYALTTHTTNTWNKVVSKRNWVSNPQGPDLVS